MIVAIIIAVVAIIAAGSFSTAETALTSISKARVAELLREETTGAAALMRVVEAKPRHINVLVLLRTLCESTSAVFIAVICWELVKTDRWAIVAAIAMMTLLSFLVVGVFSRNLGRRNPYKVGLSSAWWLSLVAKILRPLEKLLIVLGNRITPGGGFREGPFSTEVELREIVDIAQEKGIVELDERRMIQSVFDLAATSARTVMVPRPEMVWIEADKHCGQAVALCVRSGHSRLPVIGESVEDTVGVIYLKDIVQKTYDRTDGGRGVKVSEIMREATFVPDSKPLDDLLDEMQRDRNHIAMLVDEYGAIAGLISIEDILEEIVGEIADEYDTAERAPIEDLGDGRYRVVSRLSLDELVELYDENHNRDIEFDEDIAEDVDTVSGVIAYELGRVPLPGSHVELAGLKFTAEGARDRRGRMRVTTVVVEPVAASPGEKEEDE